MLIGNLGSDPETRVMPSGQYVANMRIATSESWTDKATGQPQTRTEWHTVVAFGRLAEVIRQYLHKGDRIWIEGSLKTRKWTDQNNVERYSTEIVARDMMMLSSKSSNTYTEHNQQPAPEDSGFDDDIPF